MKIENKSASSDPESAVRNIFLRLTDLIDKIKEFNR